MLKRKHLSTRWNCQLLYQLLITLNILVLNKVKIIIVFTYLFTLRLAIEHRIKRKTLGSLCGLLIISQLLLWWVEIMRCLLGQIT